MKKLNELIQKLEEQLINEDTYTSVIMKEQVNNTLNQLYQIKIEMLEELLSNRKKVKP